MNIYILIGIAVVIIIAISLIVFITYKNKVNTFHIKISEAEKDINVLLKEKRELIVDACHLLDEMTEKELFNDIDTFDEEEVDTFVFNDQLNDLKSRLNQEMNLRKAFVLDEDGHNLFSDLEHVTIECEASQRYYNDNVSIYNDLLTQFPSSIAGKFLSCSVKSLYQYKKEEVFEILKDK